MARHLVTTVLIGAVERINVKDQFCHQLAQFFLGLEFLFWEQQGGLVFCNTAPEAEDTNICPVHPQAKR